VFFCQFRSTRIEREAKANAFKDLCVQVCGASENLAARQGDALATRLVAAQADDHGDHPRIEKLARASRPGRAAFLRLESIIAVADVDRAVGAPFPAAVINVEMMAMAVMTMPMMMMTMSVAMSVVPVMAVASTVSAAMPAVTVTSSESLARDGQGSGGQRQSSDRGRNDLLDLRHGRLLGWAARRSLCDDPPLEALDAMRCDQDHPTGMTRGVRYLPHTWRDIC
jgi:hypothetical protein